MSVPLPMTLPKAAMSSESVWSLELLVAIVRPFSLPVDSLASIVPAVASWVVGLVLFGFVGRQLLSHWPAARARDPSGTRRTLVLLAIALVPLVAMSATFPTTGPRPFEPPQPLGPARGGGHIEVAGAGFAIDRPAAWSVEILSPERSTGAGQPGEAREVLRAFDPSRRQTCSVTMAVSPSAVSLDGYGFGSMTGDDRAPRWSGPAHAPVLMLPDSSDRVQPLGGPSASEISGQVRYARLPGGRDVVYGVECGGETGTLYAGISESLTLLPVSWSADHP